MVELIKPTFISTIKRLVHYHYMMFNIRTKAAKLSILILAFSYLLSIIPSHLVIRAEDSNNIETTSDPIDVTTTTDTLNNETQKVNQKIL